MFGPCDDGRNDDATEAGDREGSRAGPTSVVIGVGAEASGAPADAGLRGIEATSLVRPRRAVV
jgi:hypothetical protein